MIKSIAHALFNSYSYSEYRKLVTDLLKEGKSTGDEQSEELTNYSSLNETRMNRLEKTMKISDENTNKLKSLNNEFIWLVISEGWCGDAAQLLPIFEKMNQAAEGKIDIRIVLRDDNLDLMNHFLTNKGRAIPKLIVINKKTSVALAHWGPRPKGAADLISNYRKEYKVFDETIKTELQLWYLHDKGITTQQEIMDMMLDLDQEIVENE
ncbi:thioredoxin family protein [Flavobacterium undicola]|uniref:thioredoxin family protein n=1 Tax=Flavobacterium undicola TaxID=1932779 RepID=UPI00137891A0|nr:thioredoxin family protein [Flavobacterium undicola]MBA0882662.1 thioredoxin family protein [Flavobacterium undicola]